LAMPSRKARRGPIRKEDKSVSIGKDALLQLLDEFPHCKYTEDIAGAIGIAECQVAKHAVALRQFRPGGLRSWRITYTYNNSRN